MTTPRRGFKKWLLQAIRDMPDHTSEECARMHLDQNPDGSDARKVDPMCSLKNTADKEFREGRMPGTKNINDRYYPADYPVNGESQPKRETRVVVMLPEGTCKDVELLTQGATRSRSEALLWLVEEGRPAEPTWRR